MNSFWTTPLMNYFWTTPLGVILFVLIFVTVAIGFENLSVPKETVERVEFVKLFRETDQQYEIVIKSGSELDFVDLYGFEKARLICDVPVDKPMWYKLTRSQGFKRYSHLELHIHSENDVNKHSHGD
jgi:hypothetical protein